jgi:flagellar basal-body rod protein FlgG
MSNTITQILHINRSGMLARLMDLDVVSHNLANIDTIGFKSDRANFQEMLDAAQLNGVQLSATQRMMSQGAIRQTGQPLDLAISGNGFFAVQMPDGTTGYSRDGAFKLDANRQIVNDSGLRLVWNGTIPEDASQVEVLQDGTVMTWNGTVWTQAGQIQLARFANATGLLGDGGNIWLEGPASGPAQMGTATSPGYGQIVGRALEGSNVNIADEMTQMISLQRSYEMSMRAFQQTDQMLAEAINIRR